MSVPVHCAISLHRVATSLIDCDPGVKAHQEALTVAYTGSNVKGTAAAKATSVPHQAPYKSLHTNRWRRLL